VGRLTERKGLVPFIEQCLAQIAREFPEVDLLIAGDEPKDAVFHKTGYAGRSAPAWRNSLSGIAFAYWLGFRQNPGESLSALRSPVVSAHSCPG